jgi:hypothetical protein
MNRTQKYISVLLERLPKYELRSYEHQTSLDRIRDRISSAADIQAELVYLYQAKDCADFALSLMWIADKVEKDPTKEESTIDEETIVFSKLRQALGDEAPTGQESAAGGAILDLPGSQGFGSTPAPEPASGFNLSTQPELNIDSMFGASAQSQDLPLPMSGGMASGNEQERSFALLLEHFLESVQSGNDDRTKLLANVIKECNTILGGSAAEDYKQFCKMLTEFLQYISDNQYLDDVRVMNILSNIQDPFAQWARSKPENRTGGLDAANDILRDFKTMFE